MIVGEPCFILFLGAGTAVLQLLYPELLQPGGFPQEKATLR
jgi:hypothetical protein